MIEKKRFQNRLAQSRWSALRMVVVTIVVWTVAAVWNAYTFQPQDVAYLLRVMESTSVAIPLFCVILTSVLLGQLNSANALIRIYSRMIMCSFLAMMSVATFLFTDMSATLVTLCFSIFFIFLFRCYQDKESPGWIFYAYLAIGLASIFWVQVLFFLPILWIVTSTNLLAMNTRNFIASLLGVIAPYWFLIAWYVFNGNLSMLADHFAAIATFGPIADFSHFSSHELSALAFTFLLVLTGLVHYSHTSHQDNIRTRLLYETFITIDVTAMVFLVLQPQHLAPLYGIIALNTAPLIGHFVALTSTKWTNRYTIFLIVAGIFVCLFNIFAP